MEFAGNNKRRRLSALNGRSNRPDLLDAPSGKDYGAASSADMFYSKPPDGSVSLIDLEETCYLRLKVLKEIEAKRDVCGKNSAEVYDGLRELSKKPEYKAFPFEPHTATQSHDDHVSHWLLRLAFCRSPEAQKWFMQHEMDLFKFRLREKTSEQLASCLATSGTQFEMVTKEEKKQYIEELMGAAPSTKSPYNFVDSQDYWKLDCLEASDLLPQRRVFLRSGQAYVAKADLDVIISSKYRVALSKGLAHASKHYGAMADEERLFALMKNLSKTAYLGKDYGQTENAEAVTPAMIDTLAEKSFPLCMRSMHEQLRAQHHLKHGARMQYGLFLKGIGLNLDGAMAFFRQEFTKTIDTEKFEKQYAYNVRHNYGKEGKRANYTPYHCAKIITSNPPSTGDCHGCPFKHWDVEQVSKQLSKMGIAGDRVKQITAATAEHKYDRACTRVFEATHGMGVDTCDTLVTHPNQYYDMSRQLAKGQPIKQKTITTETVVCYSQSQSQQPTQSQPSEEEEDALIDSFIASQSQTTAES